MFLSVSDSISLRMTSYTSRQWTTWGGGGGGRGAVRETLCTDAAGWKTIVLGAEREALHGLSLKQGTSFLCVAQTSFRHQQYQ